MADKAAIGIIRAKAISRLMSAVQRLTEAINALGNSTGVESVVLPQYRDPSYQEAVQLEAIAAWLEQIADVYAPLPEAPIEIAKPSEPPPVDEMLDAPLGEVVTSYDDLTIAELKEMADQRGLDLSGVSRKSDIIRVLVEADLTRRRKQTNNRWPT